eukprot:CAMPEP_0204116842 /NCGR_PEP_ID=MMETSP0361-20130328/5650_1 /ASSEMBLY_ACC=CAM_ASM_000343 /TAXON_ID=268821 /ORGANISM="Scrippsiella Hangoei, Strain SHTV-5" /LENGTH=58 /DNA_ID=CAMNT_0051067699 /DNA_START=9 /DNA_END=185 /DNA_ORIENTATION=+
MLITRLPHYKKAAAATERYCCDLGMLVIRVAVLNRAIPDPRSRRGRASHRPSGEPHVM